METPVTGELSEPVNVGDYKLITKISSNSLSTLWKAQHQIGGDVVVLKQVSLSKLTPTLKNSLDCELNFLSSVNHPNIIRLLDVTQGESSVCLVMEFCAGGNLASYIKQHGRVQEEVAKRFMRQLGAGMEVLQSHSIVHRDLKPENILLTSAESDTVLKIADFGLSRILYPDDFAQTVCGSPLYMAPEILQFQRYDKKVDTWSAGAILFELLHGYPPFHGRTNVQLLQNIKSCTCLPFSKLILPGLHPESIDLCSKLLCINPENRLSFDDFYRHSFFQVQKLGI